MVGTRGRPHVGFLHRVNRFVETPTLTSDGLGRIWARVQIRDYPASQRADWWSSQGQWEESITAYEGDHWRRRFTFRARVPGLTERFRSSHRRQDSGPPGPTTTASRMPVGNVPIRPNHWAGGCLVLYAITISNSPVR